MPFGRPTRRSERMTPMSSRSSVAEPGASATQAVADAAAGLREARDRTLALVASVSEENLVRVHSPLMSPLVWDLGHIAAFEDLWVVHRHGGRPMLRRDLADVYDAMETPRADRGELPFLVHAEARRYLEDVRTEALAVLTERGVGDSTVIELVTRHEHQHNETMLQTLELAGLDDYRLPGAQGRRAPAAASGAPGGRPPTGLETVAGPAGPCTLGASPWGLG